MTSIATKLHKLAELADDPLLADFERAPKYVVAPDLMEILARPDVQRSIVAMVEAGIARLPFSPLLVEFSVDATIRRFVLLEEVADGIAARQALLARDYMAIVSPSRVIVTIADDGLSVSKHADEKEGMATALAVSIALLMLNVRGIDKDVIEAEALNRRRVLSGKPPIPKHTVVRVGTVYDRSGRAVGAGSGRKMPVHLRAGHSRMQAHGPERSERKQVYIPPVLVNFQEGDAAPSIPHKVLRR